MDSFEKKTFLRELPFLYIFLIFILCICGVFAQYSASGGNWLPWAFPHAVRLGIMFCVMIFIGFMSLQIIFSTSYISYIVMLFCLLIVELIGVEGAGVQRWIYIGYMSFQPSELMKPILVMVLARYYHSIKMEEARNIWSLIFPVILIALPVMLVIRQPDLGTAIILLFSAVIVILVGGIRIRFIFAGALCILGTLPVIWSGLHAYQKQRILVFFDPDKDPLGSGYHITQSKIAIGSGGLSGRGYLNGTQSKLSFLPEHQTDFIFTMLVEEMGFIGGICLIFLCMLITGYTYSLGRRIRHYYGNFLLVGCISIFFIHFFVNVAMVLGLLPIVGAPFPLVSYGGTSVVSIMIAFGLIINAIVHWDAQIGSGRI